MRHIIIGIILCLPGIVLIEISQIDYGLIFFLIGIPLIVWGILPGINNNSNHEQ